MTADPRVRADGRCARPGCGKQRKLTPEAMKYAGAQLEIDPFCSADCARAFHGCPVPKTSIWGQAHGRKVEP